MIEFNLSSFEARVLGVLAEKAFLTPDVYPLSLNATVNACNQLSNREPVMHLGEETVDTCLTRLQQNNLAQTYYPSGSRVAKYQHRLSEVFSLDDARLSLLALLLLRGPQTCGELRQRTARMYPFASIALDAFAVGRHGGGAAADCVGHERGRWRGRGFRR